MGSQTQSKQPTASVHTGTLRVQENMHGPRQVSVSPDAPARLLKPPSCMLPPAVPGPSSCNEPAEPEVQLYDEPVKPEVQLSKLLAAGSLPPLAVSRPSSCNEPVKPEMQLSELLAEGSLPPLAVSKPGSCDELEKPEA